MVQPPILKPGDMIGIVGTARKLTYDDIEACLERLKSWGLQVNMGEHLFAAYDQYAGSDRQRAHDMQYMLDHPEVKAILCARGGYGTLRILDQVKMNPENPKWIIGFSDVTALLVQAFNNGIESIHGPMAKSFKMEFATPMTLEYLRRLLMDPGSQRYTFNVDRPDLSRPGKATGRLIGGNLSILSQLLGTDTDFNTDNCILFFEDLDEYMYSLDRMVVHLRRGQKFDKIAGLMVGGLTMMKENGEPFGKDPYEIVADAVKDFDFPTVYGFPVGHWNTNFPLPLGREVTMKVSHPHVELEL